MNTTWRKELTEAMQEHGESWADVASHTLSADLDTVFDSGYGHAEGVPFTLWTTRRVYFPVVYDGREWVESVARDPDGVATVHVGGQ